MIDELIRIEHGRFLYGGDPFYFDIDISCGECVGIYVDNHRTSGTAFLGIFTGKTELCGGKAFSTGTRCGYLEIAGWIRMNTAVIDRNRFFTRELTVGDYIRINEKGVLPDEKKALFSLDECRRMRERMGITFEMDVLLADLSMLDYYRLAAYSAWFYRSRVVVLDRMTEILRQQDLRLFMECIAILMEQGAAVVLLDFSEDFLFRYAGRMDIMKNGRLHYRLYPEEYGQKLYDILDWNREGMQDRMRRETGRIRPGQPGFGQAASGWPGQTVQNESGWLGQPGSVQAGSERFRQAASEWSGQPEKDRKPVLCVRDLQFEGLDPMNFQLYAGEIGLMQDENYRTASRVRDCFLGRGNWRGGSVSLRGKSCTAGGLRKMVGRQVAVQIEMPDRPGGALFENLSALENLSTSLIPKAGKSLIRKDLMQNILHQAREWFDDALLQTPLDKWPLQERLRLAYYKWYLMNPALMVCFFPFRGQESNYHALIEDLLARCAGRGIAIWIISSDVNAICEQAGHREFRRRLRCLD